MSKAWMPLYIGDYKRDTSHLSTLEHGAYLLLIMYYWDRGPLPNNPSVLAKIAGVSRQQWVHMSPNILAYFTLSIAKQLLHHKRVDKELEKANILQQKRALAGYKGGLASRGKTNQERNYSQAFAKQMGDQSQSHINLSYLERERLRRKGTFEEER